MSVQELHVLKTTKTPEVDFRYIDETISIIGPCDPDNPDEFFRPVNAWLVDFRQNTDFPVLKVCISTNHIGSMSLINFRKLFQLISSIADRKHVSVTWSSESSAKRIIGYGRTLSELLPPSVPFKLVELADGANGPA